MQALESARTSEGLKGNRMAHDMDEGVRDVLNKIEALGDAEDPAVEAQKLTDLLKAWPATYKEVRERRQKAVKRLTEQGMTHRQIAELLDISYGRVSQIIAGETASYARKNKKAEQEPTGQE